MRDFQIAPEGNKLVVRMRESSTNKPGPMPAMKEAVVTAASEEAVPATKLAAKAQEKAVEATRSRSDVAASHFAGPAPALPSINQPPFATHASMAAEPAAINAALQQQQQAQLHRQAPRFQFQRQRPAIAPPAAIPASHSA